MCICTDLKQLIRENGNNLKCSFTNMAQCSVIDIKILYCSFMKNSKHMNKKLVFTNACSALGK